MRVDQFDKVVDQWKNYIFRGPLEEYSLEIDSDISNDIAAIALYLDQKTVKASGEIEEFYDGYRRAANDILELVGVCLEQDDENKVVKVAVAPNNSSLQEELQKHIWG
jgi:hypothetical protein